VVGTDEGEYLGSTLGKFVDGLKVGIYVGIWRKNDGDGATEGLLVDVGEIEGFDVGCALGYFVGTDEGFNVGSNDGDVVGTEEGE